MELNALWSFFDVKYDGETLPSEKQLELNMLEIAKKPIQYGIYNTAILFGTLLLLGWGMGLLVLFGSGIFWSIQKSQIRAETQTLKAKIVSNVSEKSWDGDTIQEFLDDIVGDNQFNRLFAEILALAKAAFWVATGLICVFLLLGTAVIDDSLFAIVVMPFWLYIAIVVLYDADQTVQEDFDTSLKGALGKMYNLDTVTGLGPVRSNWQM